MTGRIEQRSLFVDLTPVENKRNETDGVASGDGSGTRSDGSLAEHTLRITTQIIDGIREHQRGYRRQLAGIQADLEGIRKAMNDDAALRANHASDVQAAQGRLTALEEMVNTLSGELGEAEKVRAEASAAFATANQARQAKRKPNSKKKTKLNQKLPGLEQANSAAHDRCQKLENELQAARAKLDDARYRLSTLQARAKPSPVDWPARLMRTQLREKELQKVIDHCERMIEKEKEAYIQGSPEERAMAEDVQRRLEDLKAQNQ